MPVTSDPNATFEHILSTDKDKPKDKQAVFVMRYLTCSQWRKASKLNEQFANRKVDIDEQFEAALKLFSIGLIDWKNLTDNQGNNIAFDLDKIFDVITLPELAELMGAVIHQTLNVNDKKKLG